jgi:hypothetical protein
LLLVHSLNRDADAVTSESNLNTTAASGGESAAINAMEALPV